MREKIQGSGGERGSGKQGGFHALCAVVIPNVIHILAATAFHYASNDEVGVSLIFQRRPIHVPPEFRRELGR